MKILILKPSSLGDIVHALPVLRLLRLNLPEAEIYWWVDKRFSDILLNDKDLNGVLVFDRNNWRNFTFLESFFKNLNFSRKVNFDLIIDLQGLLRSGIFGWLSNGGVFIGVDQAREGANAFYDISIQRPTPDSHAVIWYLQILRVLNIPVHFNFEWLPENETAQDSIFKKWNFDKRKYIAICPGARWKNKRLPKEYYIEVVRRLAEMEKELDFVVVGGKECSEIAEEMKSVIGNRCINTANKTTIREMIEIVRRADFFISNDTGPLHIAAALKKPLLSFFGPTSPERTGPFGFIDGVLQVDLPCVPCLRRKCYNRVEMECLKSLTPEIIIEKFYVIKSRTAAYKYQLPS